MGLSEISAIDEITAIKLCESIKVEKAESGYS